MTEPETDRSTPRSVPAHHDLLGESLYSLHLNGLIYADSELTGPWGIDMPAMPGHMMFHIVTHGRCWLITHNAPPQLLLPGDLALIPKGEGHAIVDAPEQTRTPFFDIPVRMLSERFEQLRIGPVEGQPDTRLTCGVLGFDAISGKKLIAQLPDVIYIPQDQSTRLQPLIQLMKEEASRLEPGGETVMAHLADIIVIQALRHWIQHDPAAERGWLGALQDPKIGTALAAMHRQPGQDWTVERLARLAGMSRSGFSARFTELIGTSAKHYLTEWRMQLARSRIQQSSVTLTELAESLGYQSEAAFSRAYKRVFGVAPLRQSAEARE